MISLPADLGGGAVLRRLTMDDLDGLWALVDSERDRLGVWMSFIETTQTIEDERRWLDSVIHDEANLDGLGIVVEGAFAGGIGLRLDPFGIWGGIGYWIGRAYEGRGLVTAGVRALIDVAFREVGLHRITIRAGVENARSRAIPERLGFVREGIARGEGRGSGGYYDLVVYSMLEDEWPPPS